MDKKQVRWFEYIIVAIGVINAAVLFGLIFALPDTVPSHISANNIIDGMESRWFNLVFVFLPLISSLFALVKIKQERGKTITHAKNAMVLALTLFLMYLGWLIYILNASGLAMGDAVNYPLFALILLPIGLLFIVLSLYWPRIKPNAFAGFRSYWTLTDTKVWIKTHKIAGVLGVVGGSIVFLGGILTLFIDSWIIALVFGGIGLMSAILVPFVFSITYYYKLKNKGQLESQQEKQLASDIEDIKK